MKLLSFLIAIITLNIAINAKTWESHIQNQGKDVGNSIINTSDGGFVIVGSSTPTDSVDATKAWIIKLDSLGEIVWEKNYGEMGYYNAYKTVVEKDNKYIVGGNDILSMRMSVFSQQGDDLLDTIYANNGMSAIEDICVGNDGDIVYAGSGQKNFIVSNTEGNWISDFKYGVTINDIFKTSENNFLIAGEIVGNDTTGAWETHPALYLALIDKDGKLLWEADYDKDNLGHFLSSAETSNGDFIVVGGLIDEVGVFSPDIFKSFIVKVDNKGNILWEKEGKTNSKFHSITTKDNKNFFIGGEKINPKYNFFNSVILKIDEDGNTLLDSFLEGETYSAVKDLTIREDGILAVLQEKMINDVNSVDLVITTIKTDDTSVESTDNTLLNFETVCFPNPVTTYAKIKFSVLYSDNIANTCKVEVYNSIGILVSDSYHTLNTSSKDQEIELNLQNLTPGIYNYRIILNNKSYTGKMIKR